MGKCNWCEKNFEKGPFSNYCSKKCEKEAVDNGEKKGVSYSSGIFVVILFMIIYFSFKKCNSSTRQELNENKIENTDSITNENLSISNDTNSENQIDDKEYNSQTELNEGNSTNPELTEKNESATITENDTTSITDNSNFRMKEYEKHQDKIKKATEMLKQDKSIDEIEETSSLTRKEIRQLRRELRNK